MPQTMPDCVRRCEIDSFDGNPWERGEGGWEGVSQSPSFCHEKQVCYFGKWVHVVHQPNSVL